MDNPNINILSTKVKTIHGGNFRLAILDAIKLAIELDQVIILSHNDAEYEIVPNEIIDWITDPQS